MGTNYYLVRKLDDLQMKEAMSLLQNHEYGSLVGRLPDKVHIGKSSFGWQFLFNHNNWEYFERSRKSLEEFIESGALFDEYGREVPPEDFWDEVESKKEGIHHQEYMDRWEEFHPGMSKPWYENEPQDFEVDGLRFSTHTEFF